MPSVPTSFLIPYIKDKVRHSFYDDAVKMAESMEVHTEGEFPDKLIGERRPAESDTIKDYRKVIYEPITVPVVEKVKNSLNKIRKSQDWSIQYPIESPISEGETLQDYLEYRFPRTTSLTNWIFSVAISTYVQDANACAVTLPLSFEVDATQYLQPYPVIFEAEQVIDYKEGEFFVLLEDTEVRYQFKGRTYTDGQKFWVLQPDTIQTFQYLPKADTLTETMNIANPIGYIPVRWFNGLVVDWSVDTQLYKSRFASMLPKLNEAVREYSDLQAEIVQHVHSTIWSVQAQQCTKCRGFGECPNEDETGFVQCRECRGKGTLPLNPFEHFQYTAPKAGEPQLPTPPIGYLQKSTEIAVLQDTRVRQHIYDALASMNMEFLAEVPLAQSGVAKAVDKEELNNTVHAIAEDLVRLMDGVAFDCNEWRYHMIVKDKNRRYEMLPTIHVPEKFDMVSEAYLVQSLKGLSEAKADAAIINAAQGDLAEKMFNTDPKIKEMVKLKLSLDPFAGMAREELVLMQSAGVVSDLNLTISANINEFVMRALDEVEGFAEMPRPEQKAIIEGYAVAENGGINRLQVNSTNEPA